MIIERFAELPPWIDFEGCNFELQLIVNGRPDDVRIVYALSCVDQDSKHYNMFERYGSWENPFQEGALQGFLYLCENITTDQDLLEAIDHCKTFLTNNNLLKI